MPSEMGTEKNGKEIALGDARCSRLAFDSSVEFLLKNDAITGFDIDAYTGTVVDRWWGKLAIDIEGITTAAKNIPILRDHDRSKIVGFSTGTSKDKVFRVSGVFSQKTEHAREVMDLAAEGFPWQASIGVRAKKILSLEKGTKQQVNGKTVTGPAEIWMESEVFETSFLPLGADSKTKVTVFGDDDNVIETVSLATEQEEQMERDELVAKYPEIAAELQQEGRDQAMAEFEGQVQEQSDAAVAAERERIEGLYGAIHGDDNKAAFMSLIDSGATATVVSSMQQLGFSVSGKVAEAGNEINQQLLDAMVNDDETSLASGGGGEVSGDFMALVEACAENDKIGKLEALKKVQKQQPKAYDDWLVKQRKQ